MGARFEHSSKTPKRNPAGRRWRPQGKKVMQFLSQGRYIGVVADGKMTPYGGAARNRSGAQWLSSS